MCCSDDLSFLRARGRVNGKAAGNRDCEALRRKLRVETELTGGHAEEERPERQCDLAPGRSSGFPPLFSSRVLPVLCPGTRLYRHRGLMICHCDLTTPPDWDLTSSASMLHCGGRSP